MKKIISVMVVLISFFITSFANADRFTDIKEQCTVTIESLKPVTEIGQVEKIVGEGTFFDRRGNSFSVISFTYRLPNGYVGSSSITLPPWEKGIIKPRVAAFWQKVPLKFSDFQLHVIGDGCYKLVGEPVESGSNELDGIVWK